MASLNITSFAKHTDELRVFLTDQNIDILAINETRLNERISHQEVKVQGYDTIRRDGSTMAGSVAAYVFTFVQTLTILSAQISTVNSIRKHNSKPFVITSWYRPPKSLHEIFSHINTLLGKLDS